MVDIQPAFLRPEQAAVYLGISKRHLHTLTSRGVLRSAKVGRKLTLYSRADLERAIESRMVGGVN